MINKLIKNSVFYTVAGILPQLINFLLLPVFTRYLTPEDYAVLALVTVFSSLMGILFSFQLQSAISRFVIQYYTDEERAKQLFSGLLYLLSAVLVICAILVEIYGDKLISLFFFNSSLKYRPLFQLGVWTMVFTTVQGACQALIRVQELAQKFLVLNLIYVVLNTVLTLAAIVIFNMGVVGILGGGLIAALFTTVAVLHAVRKWLRLAFPLTDILPAVKYSTPLIPHALAGYMFMYSDRLILEKFVPLSSIGIYALADRIAMVMKLLVNSFNDAYSPHFIKKADTDPDVAKLEAGSLIGWWWGIYICFLYGIILFSKEIIFIFAEEKFYQAATLIPVLAGAYLFRGLYCFSVNGLFFKKKSWLIASITLIAGVTNVLLNYLLVPLFGIDGAAWTTVLSFLLTFLLSYYFNLRVFPLPFPWSQIAFITSIFAVGLLGFYTVIRLGLPFGVELVIKLAIYVGSAASVYYLMARQNKAVPFITVLQEKFKRKL